MPPLVSWLLVGFLCMGLTRGAEIAGVDRTTREIGGVTFVFSPSDEALVRELAPLVSAARRKQNDTAQVSQAQPASLTAADLREKKSEYLGQITRALGFETPTLEQDKSYDAFLGLFEKFGDMGDRVRNAAGSCPVSVWQKAELLLVLKRGERVPGFKLADGGEMVEFSWDYTENTPGTPLETKDPSNATYGYRYATGDGIETRSASVAINPRKSDEPDDPLAGGEETTFLSSLPIVAKAGETAADLAVSFERLLQELQSIGRLSLSDAFVLFHEAAEIGVVDRYIVSEDRRWLCDGVANYVALKIIRDRAGEGAAREAYDLEAQLIQWEPLRKQVKLGQWKAMERQSSAEIESALNKAHYAYATRAVFLMVERHGEEFLPRLFREIGKTPRDKTTMRTVEKAYRKLTGKNLTELLKAAVAPRPKQSRSMSVTRESWRRAADLTTSGERGFSVAGVNCGRGFTPRLVAASAFGRGVKPLSQLVHHYAASRQAGRTL